MVNTKVFLFSVNLIFWTTLNMLAYSWRCMVFKFSGDLKTFLPYAMLLLCHSSSPMLAQPMSKFWNMSNCWTVRLWMYLPTWIFWRKLWKYECFFHNLLFRHNEVLVHLNTIIHLIQEMLICSFKRCVSLR